MDLNVDSVRRRFKDLSRKTWLSYLEEAEEMYHYFFLLAQKEGFAPWERWLLWLEDRIEWLSDQSGIEPKNKTKAAMEFRRGSSSP